METESRELKYDAGKSLEAERRNLEFSSSHLAMGKMARWHRFLSAQLQKDWGAVHYPM